MLDIYIIPHTLYAYEYILGNSLLVDNHGSIVFQTCFWQLSLQVIYYFIEGIIFLRVQKPCLQLITREQPRNNLGTTQQ